VQERIDARSIHRRKVGGEQSGALRGSHVVRRDEFVAESRVGADLVERSDCTSRQVGHAEDHSCHACVEDCAGAHDARLDRDGDRCTVEPPRPDVSGRVADGEEFGTGGRVAKAFAFVVAAGDHLAVEQDHGTDGYVAVFDRGRGLGEGQTHEFVVGHGWETSEAADPVGMAAAGRRTRSSGHVPCRRGVRSTLPAMGNMREVVISGSGVFTPPEVITNEELVAAFNAFADKHNALHADAIAAGEREAIPHSDVDFIVKASGIERRHVMDKSGVLDPDVMHPLLRQREDDEPGIMTEMAVDAARQAMAQAGRTPDQVDAVICAASNHERAYPAVAIEVQEALGIEGFAYDMNVACSSATFAVQNAADMIRSGSANTVLIVNPEICSGHLEWRDRDCHFIFGDVCTALVVEAMDAATSDHQFEVLGTRLITTFSNNIRNNNGFLRRSRPDGLDDRRDMQFMQNGRQVFKQVVPMVSDLIVDHCTDEGIDPTGLKRLWLHQANKSMNDFIGKKVMGRVPEPDEQPNILQDYANTSSAGSIIAFSHHQDGLESGDLAVICSFGAGYSAGNVIVKKR